MDRRAFVRSVLSAVAAGAVLDVDQLLWVPGAKTIWLPPVAPVDYNTLITPAWVTREVLEMLHKQLVFTEQIDRVYDAPRPFALSVRKPASPRSPMRGHHA